MYMYMYICIYIGKYVNSARVPGMAPARLSFYLCWKVSLGLAHRQAHVRADAGADQPGVAFLETNHKCNGV